MDIMEPTGDYFDDYKKINVAVISGIAFDRYGNRLGHGKGYYDKLLAQLSNVYKIVWGIERSGFFNGREKWVKGFENQMV